MDNHDRSPNEVAFLVGFLVGSNYHAWKDSDALGRQVLFEEAESEFLTWIQCGRPIPTGVEL